MSEIKHIRKSRANVTDHRFTSTVKHANKLTPTLCGAEPTGRDLSRSGGEHVVKYAAVCPDWIADVCPECRKLVGGA